jgi:hypothetical protein
VAELAEVELFGRESDDDPLAPLLDEPEQPVATIATLAIANACSSCRIRAPQVQGAALPAPLEHTICRFREMCT